MLKIKTILCLISVVSLSFCVSCMGPKLKSEASYETFAAKAQRISVEHKRPAGRTGSSYENHKYSFSDASTNEISEFRASLFWEKEDKIMDFSSFKILGIDLIPSDKYELRGVRLVVTDTSGNESYEIIGVLKEFEKEVSTDLGRVEQTFLTYPDKFHIFSQGVESGHIKAGPKEVAENIVTIGDETHPPKPKSSSELESYLRRYEIFINGTEFETVYERRLHDSYYSLKLEGSLIAFMELKPKFGINKRGGEVLLGPDLDDELKSEILVALVITDMLQYVGGHLE